VAFRSRWPATSDAVLLKVFLKKDNINITLRPTKKNTEKRKMIVEHRDVPRHKRQERYTGHRAIT